MRRQMLYMVALLLVSCGGGYFNEVTKVVSPSGKLVAAQYHIGASAIGSDEWEIRIRDSAVIADPAELVGCLAWKSGVVGVRSIVWESETKLKLGVPDLPKAHDYQHTFKSIGCAGVSVTWHFVPEEQ